jgi:UDP:flavonoid glycosyltransferase YjiC (YdhE family)
LRAGKPTVIIPFIADQPFWGQRVYERGIGPKPISHHQLSAETLAQAIRTAVRDAEIDARAEALGEQIRAEDGVGRAADLVRHYFQGSS